MENTRNYVILYINGKQVKVQGEQVFQSLSDFLRYENTVINIYNIRSIEEDGLICFNDGYYVISKLDIELIMGKWQSMVRERKLKELLKTI